MAHTISENVRSSEIIIRYGGDEFVLILPDIDMIEAKDVAQRLHESIRKAPFMEDEMIFFRPTLSIGLAEMKIGQTPEMLLSDADAALYRAKSMGRNCTSE